GTAGAPHARHRGAGPRDPARGSGMSAPALKGGGRWREAGQALVALALALLAALVIVLAVSEEPAKAFTTFLTGPLGSSRTRGLWIDEVAKLTLTGLAFSLVFQARQFALGVQGQAYFGGLAASFVALSPLGVT